MSEGTLQIVVNLRSQSVEYSGEVGENRNSCVLKSDLMTTADILKKAEGHPDAEGLDEQQMFEMTYTAVSNLIGQLGVLTSFTMTRGGNEVIIKADDISFITLETTGVFRELQEAA